MFYLFDGLIFGLYTCIHNENYKQVFFATINRHFYHAVVGADRPGVDGSDYVYDEVFVKLWRRFGQLYWYDGDDDSVYHVYYRAICDIYCSNLYLQQINFRQ